MTLADAVLPVASLASLLGLSARELAPGSEDARIVVISGRGHALGLVVDALVGVEEILVKSLGRRLRHVRYLSGATLLPTGRLALILTPGELVAAAARPGAGALAAPTIGRAPPSKKRILVVDDSVTTRSLGKSILEAAGFEVVVAANGQEALRVLEERGADLVLSDVEMPRMDGLALTEAIRASRRFERLPVILLTGLGSERDKARGLEVGADAYLVKSAFDTDQLLETIAQLL
jgi:two-component system chemotaxis sensor kinase CheA